MKILAIDFGLKRIGFAVGNTYIKSATPIQQLDRKNMDFDLEFILQIIDEYDIQHIIMGHPLNMDGTPGKLAGAVENFKNFLIKRIPQGIDIELVDERLSSFEAEELLKPVQGDYKKRKKVLDSVSAMMLLKDYLEKT
jgi:putative Holliday junction resolvase